MTLPDDVRYLVVEGVIGAGKTSLARILSDQLNARIVLEAHEANPFLEDFYKDPERFAFQTQLNFLISRYQQQMQLPQQDIFQQHMVADYLFAKDRIFARLNLSEKEVGLYEQLMTIMEGEIIKPDLVIYLQSSVERLLRNIRLRNRYYEQDMSPDYIQSLFDAYQQFFMNYRETPLLMINATQLDFVHKQEDLDDLLDFLSTPVRGTMYYSH
ncbi:MAG: deoxynucleoside kinase [Candidatus Delongbacteria bacterium]|nr:deoxynucleoside kinase [Candidatus Delongbacteria bacterium]